MPEFAMVRKDAGNISLVTGGVADLSGAAVSPMHRITASPTRSSAYRTGGGSSGKSGVAGASFNLLNATIGAGVVALPFAIKECGFIMGIILLLSLAFVIDRCIIILIECGIKLGKFNLEEICLLLFGPVGYNVACIVMFMYSYGSMIACMVVIGDTLPWTLGNLFDLNLNIFNREVVMIISAVFIVLPLSMLKNISALSSASLLSVVAVVMLVLIVAIHGPTEAAHQGLHFDAEDITVVSPNILGGIATISFHYVCQQSCFLMFRSLKEPTLATWKEVSHYTMGVTLVMSILIGMCGYIYFGDKANGNILNNFAQTGVKICVDLYQSMPHHLNFTLLADSVITVARLFMAINMILTIPMECFIVRHAIFSLCNR
jgi:solute carrier family 38 (sodium-coupled neutral amino acid transporter), member 11